MDPHGEHHETSQSFIDSITIVEQEYGISEYFMNCNFKSLSLWGFDYKL